MLPATFKGATSREDDLWQRSKSYAMNLPVGLLKAKHKKHMIARAIACNMLLVLTSCQIPPLRQQQPGPILPANFNGVTSSEYAAPLGALVGGVGVLVHADQVTSSENSAQIGIEDFFNDQVLTNLIYQSLDSNQELKILAEDIQIASNEILARRGAYLPFVGVGAGAGIEKPSRFTRNGAVEDELDILPGRRFPNPLPDYLVAANITWQLDIWRQLRNARDAAALRFLGTADGRNYVVTRLVAEIAERYYRLMALDQRLETLNKIIELQEQSLKVAIAKKEAARGTELPVQRFQAEVRKNQSEKLIVKQEIVEVENRINFLVGRFPQPVERVSAKFLDLNLGTLGAGVPAQLLENRPDIRQAERELQAAGLDIRVARARFFPTLIITGGIGYEAFNPKYLFNSPESLVYNLAGNLVAPLINKKAIQADYLTANARQLQAVYNYQRVILNAFTEVVNRVSMVQNYGRSIEIKKEQVKSLEASVESATKLVQNASPGVDYMDVLFAQRDLMDARMVLIETKQQQLSAIVNAYQALGGGGNLLFGAAVFSPYDAVRQCVGKFFSK